MGRKPNNQKIEVVNVRLVKEPYIYSEEKIKSPDDVLKVLADELRLLDREIFAVLNLKSNGQVINYNVCSMGALDSSIVHPREVFKSSILSNAAAIIAIHNHPSGNIAPSREDRDVTERLQKAAEIIGIKFLDHVIIGGEHGRIYSFKSEGQL